MVREHLHDGRGSAEAGAGADEHADRPCVDEAIDEVLGEPPVDLVRALGRPFPLVEARIVDVHVEPVLMRDVAGPEVAAPRAAEVADSQARRARVVASVLAHDAEEDAHDPVRPVPPPGSVRRAMEERVPGEKAQALTRHLHAPHEPTGAPGPERHGIAPADRRRRRLALGLPGKRGRAPPRPSVEVRGRGSRDGERKEDECGKNPHGL
jgi:hypothetical protein